MNTQTRSIQAIRAAFGVGHVIARIAFVDCFGKQQPRIEGLKVERVVYVAGDDMTKPYFRILACNDQIRVEAAERFFEKRECSHGIKFHNGCTDI